MFRFLFLFCCGYPFLFSAAGQIDSLAYTQVRDSIIINFNRSNFGGIYRLADTSFTKGISETRLVNYLKSNRNSGEIVKVISQKEIRGGVSYRLAFEVRDMDLFLKLAPGGKFSSFGLSNVPAELLSSPPVLKSTNKGITSLDRQVDSLVLDYFRNPNAVGLSIGIVKDGKPFLYHYGELQRGTGILPTSETEYEIASVTKTFTATMLAHAVLDGKVSLRDDIRRFLPGEYPLLQYKGQGIVLLDLANHTAGLPTLPAAVGDQPGANPLYPEAAMDSVSFYAALRTFSPDTIPGYKFAYSNWGIALLGHILENIYGMQYGQLLRQFIAKPLRLKNVHYHVGLEDKSKMALPYAENGRQVSFQNNGMFGPAGDIHASLADMMRYLQAQIHERDATIRLTHQPTRNQTGLGWGVRRVGEYRDIQHNGSALGFRSHISAFPELKGGCVILANSKADMNRLILGIQALIKTETR